MPANRPRNYIERLPEIIEREEESVSHLDPEMLEILYPARAPKEFTLSVVFGPPENSEQSERYQRAVAIAERSKGYRAEGRDRSLRHLAVFGIDDVTKLHELFSLVGEFPSCEILVKGKKVPYARELWLPFFWFFKKDEG
ncbi:MAG TPA: hypothetical protein VJ921_04485 [Vicinamibacteria bacterium]|nr:hypothetical protein [Vicinamibacteria bacterium]